MNTPGSRLASTLFRRTALALALLLAFGGVQAQDANARADEIRKDLYTPDSRISIGVGGISADNQRFGQHNGLFGEGGYGLLDIDFVKRDDATGTWVKLFGKNLGLDTRELRFTHERQGDWSYTLQSNRYFRHEPLIVNSGLQGQGMPRQVISSTAPKRDLELRVDRDIFALGVRKYFFKGFDVQVSFSQEESRGDRMFGRGTGNVMEFLTEPIDRVTRQWQVVAGYADRKLQLSGGYSGSHYENHMPVLSSTGGNSAANVFGPSLVIAMPPSNQHHQVHLSGGYNLSDTARASFKLSHAVALQNETFDPVFVRLAGAPESLDGKLVTTLAFADLTLRPLRQLDLLASLRFEDRDDQTPEARFLAEAAPTIGGNFGLAGVTGLNKPRSFRQAKGQLEAGYQFDGGYRLVAGVDREDIKRNVSSKYRRNAFRERNDETTARIEFKRMQSDWLNGGIAVLRSERGGSDYIPDTYDPNALTNQVNALTWSDRQRDKLRLNADWTPAESWSLQFLTDVSRDEYSGRAMGPRSGSALFFSTDATYRINDKWNLTGWVSRERTVSRQSTRSDRVGNVAQGFDTLWGTDLRYTTQALGLTVKGKPSGKLELGADLSASTDRVEHSMAKTGGAGTLPVNSLPDQHYRQQLLKLFSDYALDSKSGVRVDLAYDRRSSNDWTWTNWTYNGGASVAAAARNSDGTTVRSVPREEVVYIGVTYHLRWR